MLCEAFIRHAKSKPATPSAEDLGVLLDHTEDEKEADLPPLPATTVSVFVLTKPGTVAALSLVLQLAALEFVSAAVLAGLRGFLVLCAAGLSSILKFKDAPVGAREWAAVITSACGAGLIGAAAALEGAFVPTDASAPSGGDDGGGRGGGAGAAALGVGLSVAGYALAAGQAALEQRLLERRSFTRFTILGVEGAWGLAISAVLLAAFSALPDAYRLEDPSRSLRCLGMTPALIGWSAAYAAASLSFNASLLWLSASAGVNTRVLIFTARGVLTWGVESVLYYSGEKTLGTRMTPFSVLVGLGYVALIGGGLWRARLQQKRQQ